VAKTDKPAEGEKSASKNDAVAYAEPGKPSQTKAPMIDKAPTGNLESGAEAAKVPLTGAHADAAGVEPEFRWPARGRIIQGFKAGGNDGINISVPAGTSVRAAESGVVVYSGDGLKGYGNLVLIKHPNGFVSAYGNNGELDVKRGDQVKRGQVIAKSGDTGNVNAPQLHFELRKGSTPVDPTNYLAGL
jgi:murein DD-endopeptidase MepM/ murein hydrolase activator NlpD